MIMMYVCLLLIHIQFLAEVHGCMYQLTNIPLDGPDVHQAVYFVPRPIGVNSYKC